MIYKHIITNSMESTNNNLSPFYFIIFFTVIQICVGDEKFCSVMCSGQNCSSNETNACTTCRDPWVMNTTTNKC